MATTETYEQLMTVPEVAEYLRVSRARAYEMAAHGEIPTVRLSARRIRIPRAALEAWLNERQAAA